jgi:transposase-like protein
MTMSQHFLLSAKARTLSLASVARMAEDEARATFRSIRWAATDGEPVCPKCGCVACYEYASRPIFRCKGCLHQFSVTSGTIFASRKLPVRDYLLAIAIFVNGAKPIFDSWGRREGVKAADFLGSGAVRAQNVVPRRE